MATDEQKKVLQYLLHQSLLSSKEFGKVYFSVYESETRIIFRL